MYLLTWYPHFEMQSKQIEHNVIQFYLLIDRQSEINIYCELWTFVIPADRIIKPIWAYVIIWLRWCTKWLNRDKIQKRRNILLELLSSVFSEWYKDIEIKLVKNVIEWFACLHEKCLQQRVNVVVRHLLNI